MKPTTVLAAGAGAGAAVLAIRQLERWCDRDECWLALADRIRRQLPPPPQSSFRVVAVVALGSRLRGEYVVGTNIEAGNLHNSVCAERVAFGALQLYCPAARAVRCIYIVTDAPQPISPGALCREFMYSSPFCTPATRVLSATPDLGQRLDVTLAELLPRASPYCRLGAADQRKWAKATSLQSPPSGVRRGDGLRGSKTRVFGRRPRRPSPDAVWRRVRVRRRDRWKRPSSARLWSTAARWTRSASSPGAREETPRRRAAHRRRGESILRIIAETFVNLHALPQLPVASMA